MVALPDAAPPICVQLLEDSREALVISTGIGEDRSLCPCTSTALVNGSIPIDVAILHWYLEINIKIDDCATGISAQNGEYLFKKFS